MKEYRKPDLLDKGIGAVLGLSTGTEVLDFFNKVAANTTDSTAIGLTTGFITGGTALAAVYHVVSIGMANSDLVHPPENDNSAGPN